ncbi:MAG: phage holin family protein [Atopobiaceae bacterium]|jgi:putative membrane protein|nr:phage holin family protein [Atopobiaceae bacterium]
MHFIGKWFITAIATAVAIWLVPGIEAYGGAYVGPIFAALCLAVVNVTIKPVMQALGLPLTILTLGIFALVVNALALELASWLARNVFQAGITINGFGSAFLGAIIISIMTAILGGITGLD